MPIQIPLVGVREGRRVISWMGVLLLLAILVPLTFASAEATYYLLCRKWIPPLQTLLIIFPAMGGILGGLIARSKSVPLDQLPPI